MVPGVYIRPDTQEATGSERRTSVDGMDVTDPFGGDIFSVNLNYEAMLDAEIKALGAEASDGASIVGQFMNVVTKSGGNRDVDMLVSDAAHLVNLRVQKTFALPGQLKMEVSLDVLNLTLITTDPAIRDAEACAVEYYPFKRTRPKIRP